MHRTLSTPLAIAIIVGLSFIVLLGTFLYYNPSNELISPPVQLNTLHTTPATGTVDGKIYKNEVYRFEFTIPKDYSIWETRDRCCFDITKDNYDIRGEIMERSGKSFEESIKNNVDIFSPEGPGCAIAEIESKKELINRNGISGYELSINYTDCEGRPVTMRWRPMPIYVLDLHSADLFIWIVGEETEELQRLMRNIAETLRMF